LQRSIDLSPLLFPDHALARTQDLGFKSPAECPRHDLLASSAHAELQLFAVDLQRPSVIANPSHKQVDMIVVGVVIIDSDPPKLRIESALHLFDQATHVFLKISREASSGETIKRQSNPSFFYQSRTTATISIASCSPSKPRPLPCSRCAPRVTDSGRERPNRRYGRFA